jgi:asparagine synthase (glutamine-hydrolysing)
MCGIAGIILKEPILPDQEALRRMVDLLIPRGPDARGEYVKPHVALGHTRLKIIDLTNAGAQPMTDPSGRYTIVYNGEVYNFQDIRGSLANRYKFKSRTDTEVVLAAFIEWREKCLDRFNGMFAFAIWDDLEKSLFIARDRLGVKPVFYSVQDKGLLFASEQKSIIASRLIEREMNPESIYHFLSFYHFPEPSTVWKNINSLPAGHFAWYRNGDLKAHRWWKPDFTKGSYYSDYKAADNLRILLEDSTRLRQVSDVPVGCFLSGGVDSTAVSALMRKAVGSDFRTYTIAFEDDPNNALDVKYAQIASDTIGTVHQYQNVNIHEINNNLVSILWRLEEPAWTSLESWFVSKLAKEGITVSLAGVGGDELFAGYFPYLHVSRAQDFKMKFGPIADFAGEMCRVLSRMIPDNLKQKPPFSSIQRFGMIESLDVASAYFMLRSTFFDDEKQKLLTPDFLRKVGGVSSLDYTRDLMKKAPGDSFIDKFTLFDIQNYLSADLLRHMDSMSMSHSLEVRVPLLDYRFVEAALSYDDEMKIREGKSKYIFLKAVDELIPDQIKKRSKVGFVFPMKTWMRKYFQQELKAVFSSKSFADRGVFNPGYANTLLEKYINGDDSEWLRLWIVFSFELWARLYLDRKVYEPRGVRFSDLAV